jgi:hypothetical protein
MKDIVLVNDDTYFLCTSMSLRFYAYKDMLKDILQYIESSIF